MGFVRRSSQTRRQGLARTYRWVTAWLIAGAVLALLLLANWIRDYLFVWRILAVQQVRRRLSEQVVALEAEKAPGVADTAAVAARDRDGRSGRRNRQAAVDSGLPQAGRQRAGAPRKRRIPALHDRGQPSAHFRNRQPLPGWFPASVGEVVVEVFPLRSAGLALSPQPVLAESGSSTPRRNLVVVEIAAPLVVRDASVIWPIRRNLLLNCSGALALLVTAVIAGLGFRSYARGRRLELQLEIARQVQAELLPPEMQACESRPAGDGLSARRAGERRLLRRVPLPATTASQMVHRRRLPARAYPRRWSWA